MSDALFSGISQRNCLCVIAALVTFPDTDNKIPSLKQLKGERVYFGFQSVMVGKSQQ